VFVIVIEKREEVVAVRERSVCCRRC